MGREPESGEIQLSREALVETFVAEAGEILAGMEQALLALEAHPDDAETLHGLFRSAHTLKGSASLVSLDAVRDLAHDLEAVLDRVRARRLRADDAAVNLFLSAVDVLRKAVAAGAAGAEPGPELTEVRQALVRAASGASDEPVAAPYVVAPPQPAPAAAEGARTLRVQVARLDRMLDLAGEIGIARGRMADMMERPDVDRAMLLEAHRASDRLHLDLQELIMQARLVPLGPTFRRYMRTVRDLAAAQGKQVQLVLEGEDVEVDTAVVEHIRDPLTHAVRNALDHGIEAPEVRAARGKPGCGRITLRAFHEGTMVVVQVADDGQGLDRQRILARAVERGLLAAGAAATEDEIHSFIFEPGFSTCDRVTEVSGRGVGLDVVRRNAEALRGSAAVASAPGAGTTITMRFPLTLAIIDGFRVRVGDDVFIIPLEAVEECLALPSGSERRRVGVAELRGQALPFLRLREHFHLRGALPARENLVVVQHAGAAAGLAVDALLGESQTVIKPLGRVLSRVRGISGSTILGDGRVALILDVAALLREALARPAAAA